VPDEGGASASRFHRSRARRSAVESWRFDGTGVRIVEYTTKRLEEVEEVFGDYLRFTHLVAASR
jgi:hypothetical protein